MLVKINFFFFNLYVFLNLILHCARVHRRGRRKGRRGLCRKHHFLVLLFNEYSLCSFSLHGTVLEGRIRGGRSHAIKGLHSSVFSIPSSRTVKGTYSNTRQHSLRNLHQYKTTQLKEPTPIQDHTVIGTYTNTRPHG